MAKKDMFKLAVVSAATALLIACGGGGGGAAPAVAEAGTAVGVLTDSPIEGVEYTTSGGYTGLTDANGNYNYNPGETVTFKIGGITLGTVEATGTVTPLELAAGDANKSTNLLVLFQSLDADGDASNGITVTAAARTAAADVTLDLGDDPADFASTGNSVLVRLIASAGTTNTAPVSPEQALAHFKEQFMQSLAGGWIAVVDKGGTAKDLVVLRFAQDGHYIMGETGLPEGGGMAGIENGFADWAPATGITSANVGLDENGEWGLSSLTSDATFRVDGDTLIVREGAETFSFTRIANTSASILGMWSLGETGPDIQKQTFVFLQNGTYMMIDPVGDEDGNCLVDGVAEVGLEVGKYVLEGGHLKVTQRPAIDQNRCAGLWDNLANAGAGAGIDEPIEISADGQTMSIGGTTLYRVKR